MAYEQIVTATRKVAGYDLADDITVSEIQTAVGYPHRTGAGWNHIPSGGSEGQILRWSANGTAVWSDEAGASGSSTYWSGLITGNGTASEFMFTHSLGTNDIIVQVFDMSDNSNIECDIQRTSVDGIKIGFASPVPSGTSYRVIAHASSNEVQTPVTSDHPVPFTMGAQTVATSAWADDPADFSATYPYKADISDSRITGDYYANLAFSVASIGLEVLAPFCTTHNGYVRIYATQIPSTSVQVQEIHFN